MRIAILESIIMPAGHEVEFDRILVDELKRQGHEPVLWVPEDFSFKLDYGVPIDYLAGGQVVTYAGAPKWKKPFLALLREKRRRAWFQDAYRKILAGGYDALIIPTATYRYIKAILGTDLKNSPVPVHIIFHGIGKAEREKFYQQAEKIRAYSNIYLDVITLRQDIELEDLPQVRTLVPPVYLPHVQNAVTSSHIAGTSTACVNATALDKGPIRLGFFGQYRQEKNVAVFLEAFIQAHFKVPVRLVVQGATTTPGDAAAFEELIERYKSYENIEFMHQNLIGDDWDRALLSVDALLLPYGAERYRYHWSAMLFTAIGFHKPVLISPEINPEVLEAYAIGQTIDLSSVRTIGRDMEAFVASLVDQPGAYEKALEVANERYGHAAFIEHLLRPAQAHRQAVRTALQSLALES